MTSLRQLYCQECTSHGLTPNSGLVSMLPEHESLICSLSVLHFGRNIIGERGLYPLLNVISKATSLHTLNLRDNGIGNEALKELCRALRHHPSLKVLELSGNPFTYLAAKHLVHLYEDNDSISFIGIDDTLMTERFKTFIHRRMQEALERKTERQRTLCKSPKGGHTIATPAALIQSESPAALRQMMDEVALPAALRGGPRKGPDTVSPTLHQSSRDDSPRTPECAMRPPLAAQPPPQTDPTDSPPWTDEDGTGDKVDAGTEEAVGDLASASASDTPLSVKKTVETCLDDKESLEMSPGNDTEDVPAFLRDSNSIEQEVPCSDKNVIEVESVERDEDARNESARQGEVLDGDYQSIEMNSHSENTETQPMESEMDYNEVIDNEELLTLSAHDCKGASRSVDNEDTGEKESRESFSDGVKDDAKQGSLTMEMINASLSNMKEEPKEDAFLDMLFGE